MKKIFQFILITAMIGGMAPILSSCSDDDKINEWNMSYVTLLPADHLRPVPSFTLKHVEEEGIEGAVEFQFLAKVQRVASQDVKVIVNATCDGIPADKINLTTTTLLIKAGTTTSEPATLTITDWSELVGNMDAADFILKIKVAGIETTGADVTSSNLHQEIVIKISKTAEKKKESVLLTNASDWIFTFMEGVENPDANSVAGTGGSDVATNGIPFWFTVDLKQMKTVTGIQTVHWAAAYAPSKVEIFTSENGREWVSIGQMNTKGKTQTIIFNERVKTRYLKYQMITVPGRVDITRFYIYSWE